MLSKLGFLASAFALALSTTLRRLFGESSSTGSSGISCLVLFFPPPLPVAPFSLFVSFLVFSSFFISGDTSGFVSLSAASLAFLDGLPLLRVGPGCEGVIGVELLGVVS